MKNSLVVSYNGRKVKKTNTGLQACPSQLALPELKASSLGTEISQHGEGQRKEQRIPNSLKKKQKRICVEEKKVKNSPTGQREKTSPM